MTEAANITPADIEAKFRDIQGQIDVVAEDSKKKLVVLGSVAAVVLVVIAFGRLVNVLAGPCGMVLLMTGFHRLMMWVNILTGVIAVLAMILIARTYGMLGVAAVAAGMMILQNVVMLALARSKSGVWTHAELNPRALLSS